MGVRIGVEQRTFEPPFFFIHVLCPSPLLFPQVDFYTSALRGAGTDANVYFQMVGERGDGEVQRVVAPREAFERGTKDTFTYR